MKPSIVLSGRIEEICVDRLGVAQLTRMAFRGVDLRPLWHELMEKATDDAAGSGMGMDLSVIAQLSSDKQTGLAIQDEVLGYQQLFRVPCASSKPRLRVLAFAAVMDIGGNTPLDFMLDNSDIELITFYVVPGKPLPCPMPEHDVAIVIAPDDDRARACLAAIDALIPDWPRPVLNLPRNLGVLDRNRLFACLSGIRGLQIPQTARAGREQLEALAAGDLPITALLADGEFPAIVRPVGSHAGFGLAKVTDAAALTEYLASRSESEFFLSRFVNYASEGGMFRKYRLVMVDGRAYACHMAIAEEWKVWYLNADMARNVANRMEEATFMRDFDTAFAVRHAHALSEMAGRIGLDYFVVDCAETTSGELLIFEADNSAIVHDMDPASVYPYKPAQMHKIFTAVQDMFYSRAGCKRANAA